MECTTSRTDDHHPDRPDGGADFVYYDLWARCKIDCETAWSRVSATCVVPEDVRIGWDHVENDVERTRRDKSQDYRPMTYRDEEYAEVHSSPKWTEDKDNPSDADCGVMTNGGEAGNAGVDEAGKIRRFLKEAGVLSANGGLMYVNEMRGYLRGRIAR